VRGCGLAAATDWSRTWTGRGLCEDLFADKLRICFVRGHGLTAVVVAD